jgi:predicted outer membrane repeat protein
MMKNALLCVFFLGIGLISRAQVIHIPADFPTIQLGIDASSEGDTVLVSPGVYLENVHLWKNITLASHFIISNDTSYISQTIIDGNHIDWGVIIMSPTIFLDSNCRLSGFTIRNGSKSGVQCSWSDPVIDHLIITGNTATFYGGGINLFASSPRIENVKITGNTAMERGGGIYCSEEESQPIFKDVTVYNNTAVDGGGIYIRYLSQPVFSNVSITGNHASGKGGGLYCYWAGFSFDSIFRSSIYENTSGLGLGMDLFYESDSIVPLTIHLDTFTVDFPSDYYAEPLHKFHIFSQHSILELIDADLFVSPSGDDNNDGL